MEHFQFIILVSCQQNIYVCICFYLDSIFNVDNVLTDVYFFVHIYDILTACCLFIVALVMCSSLKRYIDRVLCVHFTGC